MRQLPALLLIAAGLGALSACASPPTRPLVPPPTSAPAVDISSTATITSIRVQQAQDGGALAQVVQFFEKLEAGQYADAASLYGGSYEALVAQNPAVDPEDHAALLRRACEFNGYRCLRTSIAGIDRKLSPSEYVIVLQFRNEDGSVFTQEPCCGEPGHPPITFFEIRVAEVSPGEYRVLDLPPLVP